MYIYIINQKTNYMAFREIDLVKEIDNELLMFRELFSNNSDNRNYLIISQGGRIVQHMVELLVRYKKDINQNIYSSTFEHFINQYEFIPNHFRDYAITLQKFRYDAVQTTEKEKKELDEIFISFLESFSAFLVSFRNFYHNNYFPGQAPFNELHNTIGFLNMQIEIEYEKEGGESLIEESYYTSDENFSYQLRNFMEKMDKKTDDIYELNKGMSQKQDEHMEISKNDYEINKDTNQKVGQILTQINEFTKVIDNYQKDVVKLLEYEHSEEKRNEIMGEFTDKCVKKIINCTKSNMDKINCEVEEKQLIIDLGNSAWNKLSSQSKRFLITSKITYRNLLLLDDIIDYSGVCLLVTKAIEVELTKRFYKGFVKYLKDQHKKNYSEYHSSLLAQNPKTKDFYLIKPKKCDLGRITCILGFNRFGIKDDEEYEKNISKVVEYSKHKLFKDLTDEEIKKQLFNIGSDIEDIRQKYRNPAAHTNQLKRVDAEECFKFVIESEKVLKKMLDSFDRENSVN